MLNKSEFIKICFENFTDDEKKLVEIFLTEMQSTYNSELNDIYKSIIDKYIKYKQSGD